MKVLAWTLLGGIVAYFLAVAIFRIVVAAVVITLYVRTYTLRKAKRGESGMCLGGSQQAQAPVNPAPLPPDQAYKGVAVAVKPTGEPVPETQPKPDQTPKGGAAGSNYGGLGM